MRSISDIAIIVFIISVIAIGVLLEIYGFIVWAIPSGYLPLSYTHWGV